MEAGCQIRRTTIINNHIDNLLCRPPHIAVTIVDTIVQVVNVVEVQGVTEAVAGHHQDASAMNTAIATIATNSAHMEKQIVIEINTTVVVKKITYVHY